MSSKPNLVLITWHDAGRWFGCYGNEHVQTPNVDRLACDGVRFTSTFSACAICSPSRAAIVTGRRCQANGVMGLTNQAWDNRLHPTETHLGKRLRHEHDYYSALFGVQHEAAHEHVSDVIDPCERFVTDPWPTADKSADAFEQWTEGKPWGDKPFYAQIGTYEAHLNAFYGGDKVAHYPQVSDDERGVTEPYYLEFDDKAKATVANLQGLLKRGDAMIGRVMAALERAGVAENTLVVMCVDHGVGMPRAKGTCYDAGTEVAWTMRMPGKIAPGTTVDALTGHVDVLPTLLELMDLPVPENLHGVSFAGHAMGERGDEQVDAVFSHMMASTRSIRTKTHKLIRNFSPPTAGGGFGKTGLTISEPCNRAILDPQHLELYDLQADPHETVNLATDSAHAAVRDELDQQLWRYLIAHRDFIIEQPVRNEWQAETRHQMLAAMP